VKFLFLVLILGVMLTALAGNVTMASGDKVRGDEGQGATAQVCLNFDGCPYGTENP